MRPQRLRAFKSRAWVGSRVRTTEGQKFCSIHCRMATKKKDFESTASSPYGVVGPPRLAVFTVGKTLVSLAVQMSPLVFWCSGFPALLSYYSGRLGRSNGK